MYRFLWLLALPFLMSACVNTGSDVEPDRKALAERFFRGVYGCDPSVEGLADETIVVSYPIFEELFGTRALRGRAAVKEFATGFCSRWTDAQVTVHESVEEANKVVLIWQFKARNVASGPGGAPSTGQVHSWGGITLYHFNDAGKITTEIGEESSPGPFVRLAIDREDE